MEDIVKSFSGIESCFVMQAGREIRAIVTPTDVSDADVTHLSNDIAFKLRTEMQFPGQVMVTVVRESKFVDYAK
jgi:ribonuclease Y